MKQRFFFGSKRRVVAVALGATTLIALGGAGAFATFITQTASTQQVTAGFYRWAITGGGSPVSGPTALYPGSGSQVFTFSVKNTGTLNELFLKNAYLSATVTSHVEGCPPSDFVTSIDTHGHTDTMLVPGATVTVTVSVGLTVAANNTCQGTSPTVSLTITGSD